MEARAALRHLDAMRELLAAVGAAGREAAALAALYDEQLAADDEQLAADGGPEPGADGLGLEEPPPPDRLRPWREVCEPHPDVLAARFSDAEFAANLALVDRGQGEEEYVDPAAFFRITHATEGLRRVLRAVIQRLGGRGGEPVIGLQTNFGGGKTHTVLALYHLAGAVEADYRPEALEGMAPIFAEAGVATLPRVRRAVFVGTDKGAAEALHAEDGREVRTLWGYVAWRLGGWKAVETIAASEEAGTNPGFEKLIPILREAAPCLILMDEVVAFARQLRGLPYDAFHAFVQSLTEAAAAVDGAVVVGALPESGTEVGDEQGREALRRLEKIFGRLQSAWTPASGVETFEIVRRRLFRPLDEAGERARDETVRAFRKLYRDNRADFPPEAREAAYEDQMRRAFPPHPEVLRRFAGDWSALEKFQRTRGILKIMAGAVYALWQGESTAPLITPALLPLPRRSGADRAPGAAGPRLRADPATGGGRRPGAHGGDRSPAAAHRPGEGGEGGRASRVLRHRAPCRGRARRPDRGGVAARLRPARRPDRGVRRGVAGHRVESGLFLPRWRPLLVFAPPDPEQARRRPRARRGRRPRRPAHRGNVARGSARARRVPPRPRGPGRPDRRRGPARRRGRMTAARRSRRRRKRSPAIPWSGAAADSGTIATRWRSSPPTRRVWTRCARTPGGNSPGGRSWATPTSGRT